MEPVSVHPFIETVASPDAVGTKNTAYSRADSCVVDLKDVEYEEESYSNIHQNHKDSEYKTATFGHSIVIVLVHSLHIFGFYLFNKYYLSKFNDLLKSFRKGSISLMKRHKP